MVAPAATAAAAPGPLAPQVSEEQAKQIAAQIMAAMPGAADRTPHPAKPTEVKAGMQVFVRMPVGTYCGEKMERGRMFRLKGAPGDEKMVRLGYFTRYVPDLHGRPHACRVCGAEFVTERERDGHGTREHERQERPRTLDLSQIPEHEREAAKAAFESQERQRLEQEEEREDARVMRETPPLLENSTATREAAL